ncbi:cytochrome P450 [Actinomadura parmotrematis]|uniref:Cytochrome P450 n=1 Tax=Actinomadura parmotrematis TaxID=2864039 RepID=A0ABS7G2L6_9ACTN|nr:cytochrome P450 [Actinomadura parmotrematis]MBW8486967.1 cytochrome P450 [Actinomadura parmotrematis]
MIDFSGRREVTAPADAVTALARLEATVALQEFAARVGPCEIDESAARRTRSPLFRNFTRLPVVPIPGSAQGRP